jgi:hypothetical protein
MQTTTRSTSAELATSEQRVPQAYLVQLVKLVLLVQLVLQVSQGQLA